LPFDISGGEAARMNRSKLLVVALTRFYGVLMLFSGLLVTTYVPSYYHRSVILYANPAVRTEATSLFWLATLQVVLRVVGGLILFVRAASITDSLLAHEATPGFRSLLVALVKLNGFILLYYGVTVAVVPDSVIFNLFSYGRFSISSAAPLISRVCFHLLAAFVMVTRAGKIVDWLERCGSGHAGSDPAVLC
jgi:hypothetical protein